MARLYEGDLWRSVIHAHCFIGLLIVWVSASRVSAQQDFAGESRNLPLTIVGRAVDEEGSAVSGATIYLAATNSSPWKILGTQRNCGRWQLQIR